ncbi:thermonuclease family protein [Floridanema evergladense]|uniref:Thermonuclease family protein n=1 Tax=Floridaenema evergladense BLCC-F167 TaxID=3153639 RepID=A0ABV4WYW2_9CYAN
MKTKIFRFFSLLTVCSFLFLGGCQSTPSPQGVTLKVQRVLSGQAVEVVNLQQSNSTSRVQLIGLSAPELRQRPWGETAKERLQEMIGDKPVLLESDLEPKDQFDRQLAYIWQDGKLLNEQLLKEGWALFRPRSLNRKYDRRLEHAQEYARVMGLGIWSPDQPLRIPPEQFRQQYR